MRRTLFPALLAIFLAQPLSGQTVPAPTSYLGEHRVLSEREQAPIVSRWITQRFDTILPKLMSTLGPDYGPRVVSAELLAVGWLEAKLPEETEMYRHAMRISHQIIGEAFSNKVIVPGVTTTQDVVWYMRQRVAELGLGGGHRWFHPTVSVQRKGGVPATGPSTGAVRREAEGVVIERGDLLHTDFGFMYMGFATDTQHKAYVLRRRGRGAGGAERRAPPGEPAPGPDA